MGGARTSDRLLGAGVAAAVLAGGRSRRMDRDKALLPFDGEPLLLAVCRRLSPLFPELIVVAGAPGLYPFLPFPVVPDRVPGMGPLSGIDAALRHARAPYVFVTACDMPFPSEALIGRLAGMAEGADLVVPCGPDGPEPLCAIYGKGCLPAVEAALGAGRLSAAELIGRVASRVVPAEEVRALDPDFSSFRNLNTPEDYRRWGGTKR